MKDYGKYGEYDLQKIGEAKNLLKKVYEYNHMAPGMLRKQKRLKTILKKMDELLALQDE